jgi:hypothetical protein
VRAVVLEAKCGSVCGFMCLDVYEKVTRSSEEKVRQTTQEGFSRKEKTIRVKDENKI